MRDFQIRRAQLSDAPALAALSIQVWLDTYAEGVDTLLAEYVLQEFTVEKMQQQLREQDCWLAVHEACVLAYVLLGSSDSVNEHGLEVTRLYVQPRYQQQGVGRALFAVLQREYAQFWLRVYHANEKAIRFYLRQGMRQVGTCYFELGAERHENYILALGEGA